MGMAVGRLKGDAPRIDALPGGGWLCDMQLRSKAQPGHAGREGNKEPPSLQGGPENGTPGQCGDAGTACSNVGREGHPRAPRKGIASIVRSTPQRVSLLVVHSLCWLYGTMRNMSDPIRLGRNDVMTTANYWR